MAIKLLKKYSFRLEKYVMFYDIGKYFNILVLFSFSWFFKRLRGCNYTILEIQSIQLSTTTKTVFYFISLRKYVLDYIDRFYFRKNVILIYIFRVWIE